MEKCDKCGEFIEFVRLCPLCVHYEKERLKQSAKKCEERAIEAEALARELVATLKKAHEYIGDINSFYGQGLQVYGWHFNGAPEPLDNFIDSNGGCEAEEFVGRVLTKAKEALGNEIQRHKD